MIGLLVLLLVVIGIILGILIFIIVTEGRYFGKRLILWGYNRRSLAFEVRDDWQLWEHLIKRLKISSVEELLDLGTQTGHLPRLIARQRGFGGHVVGIDWSEEMIQEARRQSRLEGTAKRSEYICQDVQEALPFADNTFSLITCMTGLLNGMKRPQLLFKEIQRVLQVKGRVVFRYEPHPLRPTPIRNPEWLTRRLEPLGFTQTETVPWTPTYAILIFHLQEKL
jgi:ubiquinone/menaquinone biosynthesis C-methylase UbiE